MIERCFSVTFIVFLYYPDACLPINERPPRMPYGDGNKAPLPNWSVVAEAISAPGVKSVEGKYIPLFGGSVEYLFSDELKKYIKHHHFVPEKPNPNHAVYIENSDAVIYESQDIITKLLTPPVSEHNLLTPSVSEHIEFPECEIVNCRMNDGEEGQICDMMCAGPMSSARCSGKGCSAKSRDGVNSTANCVGVECEALCGGKFCSTNCSLTSCLSEANGDFAVAVCEGNHCKAKTIGSYSQTQATCEHETLECLSNCYGEGCKAEAKYSKSHAKCTGDKCSTTCSGNACLSECLGKSCIATCKSDGVNGCRSRCQGKDCKTLCNGKNCRSHCSGDACDAPCEGTDCMSYIQQDGDLKWGYWSDWTTNIKDTSPAILRISFVINVDK